MANDNIVKQIELKEDRVFKLVYDSDPQNPRDWENDTLMLCWHRRYNLGDLKINPYEFKDFNKAMNHFRKKYKALYLMPIYCYEHGNIALSLSREYPFNDYFDSGVVGFMLVKPNKFTKTLGEEQLKQLMENDIKVYNDYLSGNVYGFILERKNKCLTCGHIEKEIIDSCFGFYGYDIKEVLEQIKDHLKDSDIKEIVEANL